MSPTSTRRTARRVGALLVLAVTGVAVAVWGLPWVGTPTAAEPTVRPGELAAAGGRPCPDALPIGDDPSGHGFGTEEAAREIPSLLEPDRAWVCRYDPVETPTSADGGARVTWRRGAAPRPVAAGDLPELRTVSDQLRPADRGGDCTADLGPRWMVVSEHGGDLTGVVVDDYGCREVRLSDDPHRTPPGADDQEGTVGGVLGGGAPMLAALGLGSAT